MDATDHLGRRFHRSLPNGVNCPKSYGPDLISDRPPSSPLSSTAVVFRRDKCPCKRLPPARGCSLGRAYRRLIGGACNGASQPMKNLYVAVSDPSSRFCANQAVRDSLPDCQVSNERLRSPDAFQYARIRGSFTILAAAPRPSPRPKAAPFHRDSRLRGFGRLRPSGSRYGRSVVRIWRWRRARRPRDRP